MEGEAAGTAAETGAGTSRKTLLLVIGGYLAAALVALGRGIATFTPLAGGDWDVIGYPFYDFVLRTLAEEGRLPFWNPHILGGMPHLASLNSLVFYPTELPALLLGLEPELFYFLDSIAHLAAAGTAFFLWMRLGGVSPVGAFAGGLCYLLGSHLLTLAGAGQPISLRSVALQPVIFLLLAAGTRRRQLRWFAAAGLAVGACILTCALQLVAYGIPVYLAWIGMDRTAPPGQRVVRALVLLVFAAALGAIVLVPGFEYYLFSLRAPAGADDFQAGLWQMSGWDLLTFIAPGVFGGPGAYFGPHPFRTSSDYPGVIVLALAAAGVVATWRTAPRWTALALLALLLAAGTATPLGLAVAKLPVYSAFRASLRWLCFFHVSACVLATFGLESLRTAAARRAWIIAGIMLALSIAFLSQAQPHSSLASVVTSASFVKDRLYSAITPAAVQVAKAARNAGLALLAGAAALAILPLARVPTALRIGALGAAIAIDLLLAGSAFIRHGPSPFRRTSDPVLLALRDHLAAEERTTSRGPFRVMSQEPNRLVLPNVRMRYGLYWVQGLHGLPLRSYALLHRELPRIRAVADILSVRYVLEPRGERIMANERAVPRVALASRLREVAGSEQVLAMLKDEKRNPGDVPVPGGIPPGLSEASLSTAGEVSLELRRDELRMAVNSPGPAFLVLSEIYYPAWKAFVDGARTKIHRPYGALRGVEVTPGEHTVTMAYDSWTMKLGILMSVMTLAVLAVALRALR